MGWRAGVFVAAVLEGLVPVAWLVTGDLSAAAAAQVLAVAGFAAIALAVRYTALRRRYAAEIAARAADQERVRLAEDLHDVLGHELSLIALEASALEAGGADPAQRAATIRTDAEHAVIALREIVSVLSTGTPPPSTRAPADEPVQAMIERAQHAGMALEAQIDDSLATLDHLPRSVQDTIERVVREGLTNAARHAHGQPVSVRLRRDHDDVRVVITNAATGDPCSNQGSGLAALGKRVSVLGGRLDAGASSDRFTVDTVIPAAPRYAVKLRAPSPPSPALQLIRTIVVPAVIVIALVGGYYVWAVHDATTDPSTIARIHSGMDELTATALLPERQAPVRLGRRSEPRDADACRYYTNGNFPLGQATWRVCFADGRVQSITGVG